MIKRGIKRRSTLVQIRNQAPLTLAEGKRSNSFVQSYQTYDLSSHLLLMNRHNIQVDLGEALARHSIGEQNRARVVDWIIQTLFLMRTSQRTLYLAVKLVDIFISRSHELHTGDLQQASLACIFIASKYQDIKPLTLETICCKLGQNQVGRQAIIKAERKILEMVSYNLFLPTLNHWLEFFLQDASGRTAKLAAALGDISLMSAHLSSIPSCQLAEAVAFVAQSKTGPVMEKEEPILWIAEQVQERMNQYLVEKHKLRSVYIKYEHKQNLLL